MCGGGKGLLGAIAGAGLAYLTGGASLGLTAGQAVAAGAAIGGQLGGAADQADIAKSAAESQARANEQSIALAKTTADETKAANTKAATAAEEANNKATARSPNLYDIQDRNKLDAKGGVGGTLLTGPMGVDPKTLLLGKTTLLGG